MGAAAGSGLHHGHPPPFLLLLRTLRKLPSAQVLLHTTPRPVQHHIHHDRHGRRDQLHSDVFTGRFIFQGERALFAEVSVGMQLVGHRFSRELQVERFLGGDVEYLSDDKLDFSLHQGQEKTCPNTDWTILSYSHYSSPISFLLQEGVHVGISFGMISTL